MIIRWVHDESFSAISDHKKMAGVVAEVLRAHRKGNHLVVVDRSVAAELVRLDLSGQDSALLERLSSEYTQTGGLHRKSEIYIDIINSFDEVCVQTESRIEVSLGFILTSRLLDPCVLLVENLATDGWLLRHIFSTVSRRLNAGAVNFDAMHGGGDDIANVLSSIVPTRRIAVTIIDSDRNAPASPPSSKIGRLERVLTRHQWPLGKVACPPCRELENLVPLDLLIRIPSGVGCPTNAVLLDISNAEDRKAVPSADRFSSYADIKLGLSSESAKRLTRNELTWIHGKLSLIGLDVSDYHVPGYGEKVINQIMAEGKHIAALLEGLLAKPWNEKFYDFFAGLVWYFVSSRRLIT